MMRIINIIFIKPYNEVFKNTNAKIITIAFLMLI